MNNSVRSPALSLRRFAILIPALALAIGSCKNDAISPTAPVKLAFTVQPVNTIVDSSITPAIAVSVVDESGNVVTSSSALVTLTLNTTSTTADVSGTESVDAVDGVATFPYMSLNVPGTGYSFTAASTSLASATSASFNITAATTGLFASVSVGGNSSCGVTTAGAAYCWGSNGFGQLGNASTTNYSIPSKVVGTSIFTSVSSASVQGYACGLNTAGAAYCWGYNDYGQLGSGNFSNSTSPVVVAGSLTFTTLSAGDGGQACGVAVGGAAYCWGYNGSGQLGNGLFAYTSTPSAVSGGLVFATISAGENGQTCGVTTAGAAYCWGYNGDGELGNGSTNGSNTPVAVSGGFTFKSISAGYTSSCGLTTAGTAYCWGNNTYGQLGNNSTQNSLTPVAVGGGLTFTMISVGDGFACGIATGGTVYCWGYNGLGQLGVGTSAPSSKPLQLVLGSVAFASVSAGYASACAVTPGGAAYCWGDNSAGELGNQTIGGFALTPVLVVTPH